MDINSKLMQLLSKIKINNPTLIEFIHKCESHLTIQITFDQPLTSSNNNNNISKQ